MASAAPAHPLSGARVLVTGAGGFLGRHLGRRLAAAAAEVHGASRRPEPPGASWASWSRADLAGEGAAGEILQRVRPDLVFHLASHVSGSRDLAAVLPTFRSNLESTVRLLCAAAEEGVGRLVLAASMEEPATGEAEAVPASPYAAAKWAASAYGRMFHMLHRLPVVAARLFMVYGPGQEDPKKLVPYVVRSLLRGRSPELTSGRRPVDWIYVEDAVAGLMAAAAAPGVEGQAVDLGSGELVTVREVAERLAAIVGAEVELRFGALPERPLEPVRIADVAASRERIGWSPRTPLERGLQQTVDYYRRGEGAA